MSWLLRRVLLNVAWVVVGALLGMALGRALALPVGPTIVGAALGAFAVALRDALRSRRFLHWLHVDVAAEAPRIRGLWGEVAYRVERALRLRERQIASNDERLAQFLSAIDASPNGVLMLDAGEHVEWCNSAAADHFGLDPQRDRRQRVTNLVRSPDFVTYLQSGRYEAPVVFGRARRSGTLSVLARPYGDGMKLLLSQDVTERERNDAMRRDFVANVSHEIRTPLTVLAGFIETLATLELAESERRRVMQLMQQQTDRLQTLVGDLLVLAQIEGSPRPASDRWLPIEPLLSQVVADAHALSAGRHTIRLEVRTASEIAGVASELTSAVANLVNNAVRYTPPGGHVSVRWSHRADGSGELEVEDSGIGIAREHLSRLTERFYRVDQSRSRDTGGTGLGLSIVKHVVQRHGGELDIRSIAGVGSCFRVVFPPARVRVLRERVDAPWAESAAAE